jgi:hypothetical protein
VTDARSFAALGLCALLGCSAPADPPGASNSSVGNGGAAGNVAGSGGSLSVGGASGASSTGGGGSAAGGAAGAQNTGGAAGAAAGSGGASHTPTGCDGLPAVGTWEETTPAELTAEFPSSEFGLIALAADPSNPATVFFGSQHLGIWKSTDCGASFIHVNTGENGAALDGGFQWTLSVDPVDSQVLYANSGYSGGGSGAWKSTNGGVDWQSFWPPADGQLADVVDYNFVHKVRLDPADHQHLLVSFHAACKAPHTSACIAETTDAGVTWNLVDGEAGWSGGEDQTVWFLGDSKSWLYGSQSNGLWRTSDGGDSWTSINASFGGHNGGQLYRANDGAFYLSAPAGIIRSPDGVTWSLQSGSGSGMIGITGDGTTLYASHGPYKQDPPFMPYYSSAESDGQNWVPFTSPLMGTGAYEMAYDPDHHLLYSSNGTAGFWRLRTQ